MAVTLHRRQKVKPRSPGIPGLDAIHSLDLIEEVIVVYDRRVAEVERSRCEVAEVAGKLLLNGPPEERKVARGRKLACIGQSRGIGKLRLGHAKFMRLLRHENCKVRLISADGFRDGNCYVICRP